VAAPARAQALDVRAPVRAADTFAAARGQSAAATFAAEACASRDSLREFSLVALAVVLAGTAKLFAARVARESRSMAVRERKAQATGWLVAPARIVMGDAWDLRQDARSTKAAAELVAAARGLSARFLRAAAASGLFLVAQVGWFAAAWFAGVVVLAWASRLVARFPAVVPKAVADTLVAGPVQ